MPVLSLFLSLSLSLSLTHTHTHARAHTHTQVAVIEAAQNILGQKDAASEEFDKGSKNPVIVFMPEGSKTHMGGTMRLGTRRTVLKDDKCITGAPAAASECARWIVVEALSSCSWGHAQGSRLAIVADVVIRSAPCTRPRRDLSGGGRCHM